MRPLALVSAHVSTSAPATPSGSTAAAAVEGAGLAASKLRRPEARPGQVVRTALLDRLAASTAPLVSIVAPAGYGKTTLLGQWMERSPLHSVRLSLDHYDDDPVVLLHYLLAALAEIEPVDPALRRSLLAEAAVDSSWSLRGLASLVASVQTPFLLVLDHVEQVQNQRCGDLIAAIALHLPDGSRLALASRADPPFPTARLWAHGQLERVTREDLTMDEHEAALLLAGAGTTLDPEAISELVTSTEGWPVGLYLASLALRAGDQGTGVAPRLRGDDRDVADYLRAEVLASIAPSAVTFLARTSVLDQLSGPLCDAVVASTGSQELLESLEASSLLVVPLDRHRHWYRCHHLLRELLSDELERTEPELVNRLHDRAAAWFEANGHLDRAIDHAQAAGDADRAARVWGQTAPATYGAGRVDTADRWFSWFQEQKVLDRYPYVAVLGALMQAFAGGRARAQLLADAAEAGDPDGRAPDGSPLSAWVAVMEACLCRSGVHQMREDAARAREQLTMQSPLRGAAAALEGIAALLEGAPAADQLLATGAELAMLQGSRPGAGAALGGRAALAIGEGDWAAARAYADEALTVVLEGQVQTYPQTVIVFAVSARVALRGGEMEEARRYVAAAARLRPLCTEAIPWTAKFLVELARAYLALSDPNGARAVLRQVDDLARGCRDLGVVREECAELRHMLDTISVGPLGASSLTAAELRLLPLLATHLSYRDIGERLQVSRNTVKSEAVSVFRKLGVSSRTEAVEAAERVGLLAH